MLWTMLYATASAIEDTSRQLDRNLTREQREQGNLIGLIAGGIVSVLMVGWVLWIISPWLLLAVLAALVGPFVIGMIVASVESRPRQAAPTPPSPALPRTARPRQVTTAPLPPVFRPDARPVICPVCKSFVSTFYDPVNEALTLHGHRGSGDDGIKLPCLNTQPRR